MTTEAGISQFLETLDLAGLMSERKGAPALRGDDAIDKLATLWLRVTSDIDDAQLQAALVGYLRDAESCQWYPQPGTLLLHVPGRREAEIDRSDELFGIALGQVRLVGSYGAPTWPDGDAATITAGLDAIGGWQGLCALTDETLAPARASFRSVVRTMHKRATVRTEDSRVLRLVGGLLKSIGQIDAERARDDLRPDVAAELALVVSEDLDGAS